MLAPAIKSSTPRHVWHILLRVQQVQLSLECGLVLSQQPQTTARLTALREISHSFRFLVLFMCNQEPAATDDHAYISTALMKCVGVRQHLFTSWSGLDLDEAVVSTGFGTIWMSRCVALLCMCWRRCAGSSARAAHALCRIMTLIQPPAKAKAAM